MVTEGTGRPSISWIRACCTQTPKKWLIGLCVWMWCKKAVWSCVSVCVYRWGVRAGGHNSCNDQVFLSVSFRQNVWNEQWRSFIPKTLNQSCSSVHKRRWVQSQNQSDCESKHIKAACHLSSSQMWINCYAENSSLKTFIISYIYTI